MRSVIWIITSTITIIKVMTITCLPIIALLLEAMSLVTPHASGVAFTKVNEAVRTGTPDNPSGRIICGSFDRIDNIGGNIIAHINNSISDLVVSGPTVYAGEDSPTSAGRSETPSLRQNQLTLSMPLGTDVSQSEHVIVLSFKTSNYSVVENGERVVICVSRAGDSYGAAAVFYETVNGTAIAGADYTEKSGTLYWSDQDMADKCFAVLISDDITYEGNETFTVRLHTPVGASLGNLVTKVTIIDNEMPTPTPLPPTQPHGCPVLYVELDKPSTIPGGGTVRYKYEWTSSGSDAKVVHGPKTETEDLLRHGDGGATFDEGETWTVTVTPYNDADQPGQAFVAKFIFGKDQVTFKGWIMQ